MLDLKRYVRNVPDFPKPGILFRDITPMLRDPRAFAHVENRFVAEFAVERVTAVGGIESRGFLFGVGLAQRLGVGFFPIRKAGKLPGETLSVSYALEYGEAVVEIQKDALGPQDRVIIVDDLLATGGTAAAAVALAKRAGASVAGVAFVIELAFLGGRKKLAGERVLSLISYDGED
jgi:adenine phosphoribosyltransferase